MKLSPITLVGFFVIIALVFGTAYFSSAGPSIAEAQTSCSGITVTKQFTNYSFATSSVPWSGSIELQPGGFFECAGPGGTNPGPWRLAIFDQAGTMLAKSPSNGGKITPITAPPATGQSYKIQCIQVVGSGNETPTGVRCGNYTVTGPQPSPSPTAPVSPQPNPTGLSSNSSSCGQIVMANQFTNYSTTPTTQAWKGTIALKAGTYFECASPSGSNPGPWRLAVLDKNGNVVVQSTSNGGKITPITTPPASDNIYAVSCIQVVGSGNETYTGQRCVQFNVTAAAASPTPGVSPSPITNPSPTPLPSGCPRADLNNDCRVDLDDYSILIQDWGKVGTR